MQLDVFDQPPADYLQLVWDEFCGSRGRGQSIGAHFSWMTHDDAFSIVLSLEGMIVGGLAVAPITRSGFKAGRIGAVVVAAAHRGQGHSLTLLEAARREGLSRGLDDLILWTGTPAVYERIGFQLRDQGLFGTVSRPPEMMTPTPSLEKTWPTPGDNRDLPLFARGACVFESPRASIVVLNAQRRTLAEWTGDAEDVLDLVAANLEVELLVNARRGDPLLDTMEQAGWKMKLEPTQLQMICPLSDRSDGSDRYALMLLDRI